MAGPFEQIASLNRLIHEPARLAILTALAACDRADFMFLLSVTGLTKGNLSSHLSKLVQAGLIEIEKQLEGSQPVTYVRLTPQGREAIEQHWAKLHAVRQWSRSWKPASGTS